MDEKGLHTRFLRITSPWCVKGVTLDEASGTASVIVHYRGERLCACPECGRTVRHYDERARSWRHLDGCQYKTIVSCEIPSVEYPKRSDHQIPVPWADSNATLTALFEVSPLTG